MFPRKKKQEIQAEIKRIDKLIAHLTKQKEKLLAELETYKGGEAYQSSKQERLSSKQEEAQDLIPPQPITTQDFISAHSICTAPPAPIEIPQLSTPPISQKISLIRSLFQGRTDVYALRWTSRKTGKSGYSPVCANEWKQGICRKITVKCSDCPHRDLSPLTDDVIKAHLTGTATIGVYPLLENNNCCFLAADFDGQTWMDDVFAFKNTCDRFSIPTAIERSRSGKGAHAWIFFEKELPATTARKLGFLLISETMSNRYQLDMKSYDRLFPNQDYLPKGGFGNLIALPLQGKSASQGNSVFIQDSGTPYDDQWSFLSGIKKISADKLEVFFFEASASKKSIAVNSQPQISEDPPWKRPPSGEIRHRIPLKYIPKSINIVKADRLYIKTHDVPSPLLNQIKQLAAFQNPEFYRRQNMRLSVALTPRMISCSEIIDDYLVLPRGCLEDIKQILGTHNIDLNLKDKSYTGQKADFTFIGSLSDQQTAITKKILKHNIGTLVSPPGSGKTILAIYTIAKKKRNTLILVHRKPLMEQWKIRLAAFLDIDKSKIGQIGGGKNKPTGILDVALFQSLERKGKVDDRVADYGYIIVDECHHVSAVSFERVMSRVKAKHVLGLTATPYRRDGHQPIISMQCGPIRYQMKQKEIAEQGIRSFVIPKKTSFSFDWSEDSKIYDLWPKLIQDEDRNDLIVSDILTAIKNSRYPIILTERIEHLNLLESRLTDKIDCLAVLHGGIRPRRRLEILEELKNSSEDRSKAILATGSYIGEGFDDPRLDTLFLTMPISFKGKIVQYSGRLQRRYKGKTDILIHDYVDENVSILAKMFDRRLKAYKAIGFEVEEIS